MDVVGKLILKLQSHLKRINGLMSLDEARGYVRLLSQMDSLKEYWQVVSKVRGWHLKKNVSLPV